MVAVQNDSRNTRQVDFFAATFNPRVTRMNAPKWPVELPQTYDVVSETAYELDLMETPTQTSAYYKIETRRLHGILNDSASFAAKINLKTQSKRDQQRSE